MPAAARTAALLAGVSALALVACGSRQADVTETVTVPAAPAQHQPRQRAPAPPAATRVIRAWSDTLRRGDVDGAARYFALPSIVQIEPGGPAERLTRRIEAVAFQSILPCGAQLVSAVRDGPYVNALFRLTERPGATCDAPGATARTAFLIRRGKIKEWRRAPDEPGDEAEERSNAPPV
jgi:hypothetical protein